MTSYNLTHLKELESEAIFILREVASQFEKLNKLYKSGALTKDEFEKAKKKLLN